MPPRAPSKSRRSAGRPSRTAANAAAKHPYPTDRVVEHIRAGVLAGRYVPGQRLFEAELTHALRVSRSSVREAFRRLDALQILTRTMHRGACVSTLGRSEAVDLMIASAGIDGLTARLAATAVKSREGGRGLATLERELKPYRDRAYDLATAPDRRQRFYDILIAMTGNSQLPALYPTMRIHLLRLQTQSFRDVPARRSDVDDFAAVAAAVLAGDAGAAEKASSAHHRRVQRALFAMPDEAFPRMDGD